MKPIKICEANREKIEAALLEVNGKAESFTLTLLEHVNEAVEAIEDELLEILPKKAHKDAFCRYTGAGPYSSSYKNQAITTCLHIERRASGFYLNAVVRACVFPKKKITVDIRLTQVQRKASEIQFKRSLAKNFRFVDEGEVSAHQRISTLAAANALLD